MATAAEYLQPLLPGLVPVPAPQAGICSVCRTATNEGYDDCYHCSGRSVSVVPISMSIHGMQLHRHLWNYKNNQRPAVREKSTLRLAALLEVFLQFHLDSCLGGPVPRVATVPSERRDAPWEIIQRLRRFTQHTNPLTYQPGQGLVVTDNLRNQRVLLVDDTFTTGRTLFDAHQVLTDTGAVVAGPLVLGRHVQPDWPPSKYLLQRLEFIEWHPDRCCRCAGIVCDPPLRDASTSLFG